jgi:hypothetical protein
MSPRHTAGAEIRRMSRRRILMNGKQEIALHRGTKSGTYSLQ